jgi:hypothetical protein
MKPLLTFLFLLFFQAGFSQSFIPEAIKVKTAFENLSVDPDNKKLQKDYISAFPNDTKTFLKVFQTEGFDQLYSESYKYLNELERCSSSFPNEVINKCINIGKNLVWDADAVGQLQHISVTLNAKYISVFVNCYRKLNTKEQDNLIKFYADVENHNAYKIYQDLIDKLNSVGQRDISEKLETARKNRKQQENH